MANVIRSTYMPIVILMEVTVALISQLEIEYAMMSTILQPVNIMMEVTVVLQTSQIGLSVPAILN